MNAKTEKRLGIMAAFLLTAAIFVAPNPIQQVQTTWVAQNNSASHVIR